MRYYDVFDEILKIEIHRVYFGDSSRGNAPATSTLIKMDNIPTPSVSSLGTLPRSPVSYDPGLHINGIIQ